MAEEPRPALIDMYRSYEACLVRVSVETAKGDLGSGTAFHIGNGYLATARHVVEDGEVKTLTGNYLDREFEVHEVFAPDDPRIDLAIIQSNFELENFIKRTTSSDGRIVNEFVPLGGHLDDWIGTELVLSRVLALGYPPVPRSNGPVLVASDCHVSAVVDRYDSPHPNFILSLMSRGGFSGGPAISEYGFLLGVMNQSLTDGGKPAELGYMAALSIEPLLELIMKYDLDCGENTRHAKTLFGESES